uniref:LRRCT domain-containing protein n=1 Tax=Pelusios castaneus TaxID=367368 RepID=A0A8C8S4J3_9SAUR
MTGKAKDRDMCGLQNSVPCIGVFLHILNCFLLLLLQKDVLGCPSVCQLCTGKQVNCRNLGLSSIPKNFPKTTVILYLSGNNISGAFLGMISLQTLNLANNKISRISDTAFRHLGNLVYLYLEDTNKIVSIGDNTFEKMGSLKILNLASNNLTNLQPTVLKPLVSLIHLQANHNPWNCSCKLFGLRNWLASSSISVKIHCHSPPRMRGRPVHYIKRTEFTNCAITPTNPVIAQGVASAGIHHSFSVGLTVCWFCGKCYTLELRS